MRPAPLVRTKAALACLIASWKAQGRSIGFVATMGALHRGHAELVRRAAADNDRVLVSIFVNPLQFGPKEDYARYPRALPADRKLVAAAGADAVYAPAMRRMYPEGFKTHVEVEGLSDLYCGRHRPGHFRGVATVVLKLFNQVRPDRAYFGEKDFQQFFLLKKMTRDLDVPVRLIAVPTVREKDGLALSSRNAYLSPAQRAAAPTLRAALKAGRTQARRRDATPRSVEAAIRRALRGTPLRLQYAAVTDEETLLPSKDLRGRRRLLAAVFLGRTRLIDNLPLEKRR